jgi:hypothetical protein
VKQAKFLVTGLCPYSENKLAPSDLKPLVLRVWTPAEDSLRPYCETVYRVEGNSLRVARRKLGIPPADGRRYVCEHMGHLL